MTNDRDIYVSAKLLIKQHGSDAEDVAMERMLLRMQLDDVKGASIWLEIMNAMDNLTLLEQQKYLH